VPREGAAPTRSPAEPLSWIDPSSPSPSLNTMSDHSSGTEGNPELREFLRSRRSRITPEEAGLPVRPGTRRVPGLRREEVAQLAGVSVD
jgi:hypothetical protein